MFNCKKKEIHKDGNTFYLLICRVLLAKSILSQNTIWDLQIFVDHALTKNSLLIDMEINQGSYFFTKTLNFFLTIST